MHEQVFIVTIQALAVKGGLLLVINPNHNEGKLYNRYNRQFHPLDGHYK